MVFHLEFYWVLPQGDLGYCDTIVFDATSMNLAVAHAKDVLEHGNFPSGGRANACLIKGEEGKIIEFLFKDEDGQITETLSMR